MAGVPVEQGAGLGEDGRLAVGERRGEGPHVDQPGVEFGRDVSSRRIDREVRAPVAEAEKDQWRARADPSAPRRHGLPVERRCRRAPSERLQIPQRQQARLRVVEQLGDPVAVIAALAGAVQRIAAEAMV